MALTQGLQFEMIAIGCINLSHDSDREVADNWSTKLMPNAALTKPNIWL